MRLFFDEITTPFTVNQIHDQITSNIHTNQLSTTLFQQQKQNKLVKTILAMQTNKSSKTGGLKADHDEAVFFQRLLCKSANSLNSLGLG